MKGIGGLAAISMSGIGAGQAQEVLDEDLQTDPHTRDTWRAIVDAIVPTTPELEDELGPEHVPGGLDVELEKFLVWDFNHFQEVRAETLAAPTGGSGAPGLPESPLEDPLPEGTTQEAGKMDPSRFEFAFDRQDGDSDLAALVGSARDATDVSSAVGVDLDDLADRLDLGALDRLTVGPAGGSWPEDETGPVEFLVEADAGDESIEQTHQNYPYAVVFPLAFDLVAAEFLLRGENEDEPAPNEEFPAGGTFVRLSREDRLRCLWTIADGGAIDRLDELLSAIVTDVGILKFVVMATNGLHGFGYYTEWSGYGDTKTATPAERTLETPPDEVQSRTQTGYPGPADGYAADWRHVVDGGFTDEWDEAGGGSPPDETPGEGPPDDVPGDPPEEPPGSAGADDDGSDDGGGSTASGVGDLLGDLGEVNR